jgi:uncharacterized membrane protein
MTSSISTTAAGATRYTRDAALDDARRAAVRIRSIDVVRGIIMVLMAIDHVRVYSGLPAGDTTPALFFTRWVTHFCAPGFALLAGTSAYLHGVKLGNLGALSRFLVVRGALLVLLELTLLRVAWTFTLSLSPPFAGVIWMLGWSMIGLAALVHLGPARAGALGVAIMALQQLLALVPRALPGGVRTAVAPWWELVYPAGAEGPGIIVLYVLIPWIGVMAAGYGLGALLDRPPAERDRWSVGIGAAATAVFLLVAGTLASTAGPGTAAEPSPPWFVRLLNQQKYPASQLFLLMTLGPILLALPWADRARGALGRAVETVGRVPLFYYLLHIPLIHLSALVVNVLRTGGAHREWYAIAPFAQVPEGQRWPLALLYAVFVVDVALLYAACRWYARRKAARAGSWLRYL